MQSIKWNLKVQIPMKVLFKEIKLFDLLLGFHLVDLDNIVVQSRFLKR